MSLLKEKLKICRKVIWIKETERPKTVYIWTYQLFFYCSVLWLKQEPLSPGLFRCRTLHWWSIKKPQEHIKPRLALLPEKLLKDQILRNYDRIRILGYPGATLIFVFWYSINRKEFNIFCYTFTLIFQL